MSSGSAETPNARLWQRKAEYQNFVVGFFVVSGLTKRRPYAGLVKRMGRTDYVGSMSHVAPEQRARYLASGLRASAVMSGDIRSDARLLSLALCKESKITAPGSAKPWASSRLQALESWVWGNSSDFEPFKPIRAKLGQAEGSVLLWPERDSPFRRRMSRSLGAIALPHPLLDSDATSDIVGIVRVGTEDGMKGWPLAVHQHPDRPADDIFEQFVVPDVLSL